jgi:hypothetical protein
VTTNPQKITFGERRASGVRNVLIYCRDQKCSHYIEAIATAGTVSKNGTAPVRGARLGPWGVGLCTVGVGT